MPSVRSANFDRLARCYAPLEWLSFGHALSRRRMHFIDHPSVARARRALVLGDGDGRFSAALVARSPGLEVTAVDTSAAMLAELERRVRARSPDAALTLCCADARRWPVPDDAPYDLVVSHFFFDCFTQEQLDALVARITPALKPDARWLVSDFAIPAGTLWNPLAKLLVRGLYCAFRLLTGLRVTRLPDHARVLHACGFRPLAAEIALGGSLRSELWLREPAPVQCGAMSASSA